MNLLEKLTQNKKDRNKIQESIKTMSDYTQRIHVEISRLLKLISETAKEFLNIQLEISELYQKNKSNEIIKQLDNFEYYFNSYRSELANIKKFNETKPRKKLTKKIKNAETIVNNINNFFIEIYSKFLVLIQFNYKTKEILKNYFIKVIQSQKIPIHTIKEEQSQSE